VHHSLESLRFVIEVVTVAALVLAWFTFRYERHGRWRAAIDAAYGSLRAVHHGMVQGLTPGQATGWGQLYFFNGYTDVDAQARAQKTYALVIDRGIDQVFVVPTEPLAKLATATPQDGLLTYTTIAVANFALWKAHVFNQLVRQLTEFNAAHAAEIPSADDARREDLAKAAYSISWAVHRHGIGESWVQRWHAWVVWGTRRRHREQHARARRPTSGTRPALAPRMARRSRRCRHRRPRGCHRQGRCLSRVLAG
jgi:hypothetical protein